MTTIVIDENREEGRSLMNVIRAMGRNKAIVSIRNDDQKGLLDPKHRIAGLAYTKAERIESVRRSTESIRRGDKTYTTEEVRAMFPRP